MPLGSLHDLGVEFQVRQVLKRRAHKGTVTRRFDLHRIGVVFIADLAAIIQDAYQTNSVEEKSSKNSVSLHRRRPLGAAGWVAVWAGDWWGQSGR